MTRTFKVLPLLALIVAFCWQTCIAAKPIKILMVSGGGYHDYVSQPRIIIDSINKYVGNIDWHTIGTNGACDEIVPLMTSKDWAKGYDIVIYNVCWAYVYDTAYINNICRMHHDNGISAMFIHCTMHTYRDAKTDLWHELLGVESHEHASSGRFVVKNINPQHPVMRDFPLLWNTPVDDELYKIVKQFTNTVPLATAKGDDGVDYPCLWTGSFGKAKVIGSTVGHAAVTFQDHDLVLFLAHSVLWLTNNIDEKGEPFTDYWKLAKTYRSGQLYKHNELLIDNFENYTNKDEIAKAWGRPGWGNEITASVEKNPKAEGKNVLKVSYKTANDDFSGYALVTNNKKIDLAGYNAIQFWFKPDGSGHQLELLINLANEKGEYMSDNWETIIQNTKGDTTGRIVTISFSDFKRPYSIDLVDKDLLFNTNIPSRLSFLIRNRNNNPGSGTFYLDNIKAITQIKLPVVIDNFDQYVNDIQLQRAWYIPGHGGVVNRTLEPKIKGAGKYSLKCEYTTSKTSDKFYAPFCRVDKWDLTGANALQFWFKPDGSGREIVFEFNIANSQGNNIHDLWDFHVPNTKGDTAARLVSIPFSKLSHNTKFKNADDVSPVFLPGSVIEVAFCIGGKNDAPGNGVIYLDEFKAVNIKE